MGVRLRAIAEWVKGHIPSCNGLRVVSRYVIGTPLLRVLLQCGSDAHVKMRKFFMGIGNNQTYRNNSVTKHQCVAVVI